MKDRELIERIKNGEDHLYNELVKRHWEKIVALCKKYVKEPELAEDLAQDTFLKGYINIQKFKGNSAFSTWAYRIAANNCKNYLTSQKLRVPRQDVDISQVQDHFQDNHTPEEDMHTTELEDLVLETLETLPDHLQSAYILSKFQGMTHQQISDTLDIPLNTVKIRIHRAKQIMNDQINNWRNE